MAILLLHRSSGVITLEAGSADEYAHDHGFDLIPNILDGDECVKLLRDGKKLAPAGGIQRTTTACVRRPQRFDCAPLQNYRHETGRE